MFRSWKYPFLLLSGIGLSNIGDWIYLIALNLIVLEMTGSPLAVAVLYLLKPVAALLTNVWAGSFVDRVDQRNLMIGLDVFRAILLVFLPAMSSLPAMYGLVLIVNMAGAVFEPASMTYVTKLIPREKRKRFNALRSLIDSGGFLIGPAMAGVLFIIGTPELAIYFNACTFFLSGIITLWLPRLEKETGAGKEAWSVALLRKDWNVVRTFAKQHIFIMTVYFLFGLMMVMTAALDSLEAAFSKEVLGLTDTAYGFLVSIAGAGIAVGALVVTCVGKDLSTRLLLTGGGLFVACGYLIYACSVDFSGAALGFFLLSFALAFANTGFHTFYQESIPVGVMGRVTSVFGLLESVLVILATITIGAAAEWVSVKAAVVGGSWMMLLVTLGIAFVNRQGKEKEVDEAAV
ncbi:MFS transporter [Halobacillus litoralis]|uniref:MFS transporter n=1 Tax=Halobacillus litoralis TaxID=45668 RepID=A0A845F8F7_9BACI|nr:MFS transporter [Halobacillus litoralis]MYL70612.1 MFS transporter [Halobacillus litoralis]